MLNIKKTKPKKTISARVDSEIVLAIKKIAKKSGVSFSKLVEHFLIVAVDKK